MDLSNFTEKSREALTEAQNIGTRLQHQAVDVERYGSKGNSRRNAYVLIEHLLRLLGLADFEDHVVTLKPTTLLTLFNTPQLKAVAQEVDNTWLNHAAIGCS